MQVFIIGPDATWLFFSIRKASYETGTLVSVDLIPSACIKQDRQYRNSLLSITREALIRVSENDRKPQLFVSQADGRHAKQPCADGAENSTCALQSPLEDYLVPREWHKSYADALLEFDPSKLSALIAVAEREISNRYLELQIFPTPVAESRDLDSAVRVLSHLQKSETIV